MKSNCIIIALSLMFLASTGTAQSFKLYSSCKTAGAAWDSLGFTNRIQGFTVSSDAGNGNDTLFIAINNDTTRGRIVPLFHGEVIKFNGLQARCIRTRSSGSGIVRRIIAY